MLVLVQTGNELRGGFLTDGDSHGSYLLGSVDGRNVHLTRRWRTGAVLHEQFYELVLDVTGQELVGTFTEPAFDQAPHRIRIQRGFAAGPRAQALPPVSKAQQDPYQTPLDQSTTSDPNRPCDCKLVCYCGGVPPGPDHYRERARCGDSCTCRVCPPLP